MKNLWKVSVLVLLLVIAIQASLVVHEIKAAAKSAQESAWSAQLELQAIEGKI